MPETNTDTDRVDRIIKQNLEKILQVFPESFDLVEDDLQIIGPETVQEPDFHFTRFTREKPILYTFDVAERTYSVRFDDEFADERYRELAEFWKNEVFLLMESTFVKAWLKKNKGK